MIKGGQVTTPYTGPIVFPSSTAAMGFNSGLFPVPSSVQGSASLAIGPRERGFLVRSAPFTRSRDLLKAKMKGSPPIKTAGPAPSPPTPRLVTAAGRLGLLRRKQHVSLVLPRRAQTSTFMHWAAVYSSTRASGVSLGIFGLSKPRQWQCRAEQFGKATAARQKRVATCEAYG